MSVNERVIKRYSENFKLQVLSELEESGCSVESIMRKYGITGKRTIRLWINKYGRTSLMTKKIRIETPGEADQTKILQKKIKELESALADMVLTNRVNEEMFKILSERLGYDVKKKFGTKPSSEQG